MKKRPVLWRDGAREDLEDIAAYIAADNPAAALRVVDAIEQTASHLGRLAAGHRGRVEDTYEIGIADLPYIIAYAIQETPDGHEDVVILRVIHGARNWPANEWPG